MRYAIISDIHANIDALLAVLDDVERQGDVGKVWCLGDVIGYGPDPHECIRLLRQLDHVCVAGNHDWVAVGKADVAEMNPDAARAIQWTAQQLIATDIEYLKNLPLVIEEGDFTLVHGSPREPIWEYLISIGMAKENFAYFGSPYCLVGHSHVPLIFRSGNGENCTSSKFLPNVGLALGKKRLIINPGSVGQPRDGDPRASYAIYDSETKMVRLYRVSYNVRAVQDRMVKHGLPLRLVARLSSGV